MISLCGKQPNTWDYKIFLPRKNNHADSSYISKLLFDPLQDTGKQKGPTSWASDQYT